MSNFLALLLFAGIGSLFGPVGFMVGTGVGIVGWIHSSKGKTQSGPAGSTAGASPPGNAPEAAAAPADPDRMWGQPLARSATSPIGPDSAAGAPAGPLRRSAPPSSRDCAEYAACLVAFYAVMLSLHSKTESTKVDEVTDLLEADGWVADKFEAIEDLAALLPEVQDERWDSPMRFRLRWKALIGRVMRLDPASRHRFSDQVDRLAAGLNGSDPPECRDHLQAIQRALHRNAGSSRFRADAEEYIRRSGDRSAIRALKDMHRDPSRYRDILKSRATGNTVLKTALGVFAGLLAMDAVRAAVTEYQKEELLAGLDGKIEAIGGMESLDLPAPGVEATATTMQSFSPASDSSDPVPAAADDDDDYDFFDDEDDSTDQQDIAPASVHDARDDYDDEDNQSYVDEQVDAEELTAQADAEESTAAAFDFEF